MSEIDMLRATWRELETGLRITLTGHEGGNARHRQGLCEWATAPVLDPTRSLRHALPEYEIHSLQERNHQGLVPFLRDG